MPQHSLRPDWQDESPSTPSHLRILYLGKILQDEDTLTREYMSSRGCLVLDDSHARDT